jgi:hypothetical protein
VTSRQLRKSRATRRVIIDTTIRCLVKHGYSGTTYLRIAGNRVFARCHAIILRPASTS